ncbi:MAG: hypothetical protein JWR16_2280 [Nevskia sp.]|nr:hypothetical protein [Nevskia sp.]
MNFLAHLWLAEQAGAPLAGAILGDFIRGRVLLGLPDEHGRSLEQGHRDLPAALARSILLHRRIDISTDHHARVRAAMAGFEPGARRYAGILLDLIYDHLLARNWPQFSAESLSDFAARAAQDVAQAGAWFEQAGSHAPSAWRFRRLLLSYRSARGIDRAIARTATRLRKPQGLLDAARGWPQQLNRATDDLAPLLADLTLASRRFMLETPLPGAIGRAADYSELP